MSTRLTLTGGAVLASPATLAAGPATPAAGPATPAAGLEGAYLDVIIMRAGPANGLTFPAALLAQAAPLFVGAPCYVDHAGPADAGRPGGRSVRDLAGTLVRVGYAARPAPGALTGRLRLYRQAGWLARLAREAASLPQLGLSAVLWVEAEGGLVARIDRVESVDIVMNPAAGGRLLGPAAAPWPQGGLPMNDLTLSQHAAPEGATLPQRVRQAAPPPPTADPPADAAPAADPAAPPAPANDVATLAARVDRLTLDVALAASGLPAEAREAVRTRLSEDPAADAAALIALYRDAYGRAAAQGAIRNLGRVTDMLTPLDRIGLAVERLVGVPAVGRAADVPRLSGIREAYDLLTGDWERYGVFRGERVTLANATTATMAQIVANALNKVLLSHFESRPRWWAPIVHEEDFATLNDVRWITVGGFSDLDAVAEGGPYVEKPWDDYAETSPFTKRGNYIGLTLEMIDRDDVAAVRAIPRNLAHAAWRTLSSRVALLFTENAGAGPLLADGEALFAAAHGNLGSTALASGAWQATVAAMFKQQEFGSAKRLGLRPRYCLVPIDLEKTALEIFTSDVAPVANAAYRNVLQRSAENIVVVPDWTDATDWAAVADPAELEGVCIGYRFGRTPELFVADADLGGAMFTNDEMRVKVRFIFAVGIGDYRALYKHNVA
jgi:hypothetical protein